LKDKKWLEQILAILEAHAPEQAKAQKEAISFSVRYRPEEVAASFSAYVDTPISLKIAEPMGKTILKAIQQPKDVPQ
jgi:hypothetical protein